jgi:hypothetical protein
MKDIGPEFSFRGLPLSAEQESVVRHYIHQQKRRGLPYDTQELRDMLDDMLDPPIEDRNTAEEEGAHASAERAVTLVENSENSVSASEERTAAREAEAMKHPEH